MLISSVKDLFFEKKFGWFGALFDRSSPALKLREETLYSLGLLVGLVDFELASSA